MQLNFNFNFNLIQSNWKVHCFVDLIFCIWFVFPFAFACIKIFDFSSLTLHLTFSSFTLYIFFDFEKKNLLSQNQFNLFYFKHYHHASVSMYSISMIRRFYGILLWNSQSILWKTELNTAFLMQWKVSIKSIKDDVLKWYDVMHYSDVKHCQGLKYIVNNVLK